MQIILFYVIFVAMELAASMFIPNEGGAYADQSPMTTDQMNEQAADPNGPGIRIRINTNGGNVIPYILLNRRPNTNMRLRIRQSVNMNDGPVRIVYKRNDQSKSQQDVNLDSQINEIARQRLISDRYSEDQGRQNNFLRIENRQIRIRNSPRNDILNRVQFVH